MTDLKTQWIEAKKNEKAWADARVSIESAIYEANRASITDKGTFTTEDGMKIATGYTETWDEEEVAKAAQNWQANVPFPFVQVFKPDAKALAYVKEHAPEAYKQLQSSLTVKPRKPAFSVKE